MFDRSLFARKCASRGSSRSHRLNRLYRRILRSVLCAGRNAAGKSAFRRSNGCRLILDDRMDQRRPSAASVTVNWQWLQKQLDVPHRSTISQKLNCTCILKELFARRQLRSLLRGTAYPSLRKTSLPATIIPTSVDSWKRSNGSLHSFAILKITL